MHWRKLRFIIPAIMVVLILVSGIGFFAWQHFHTTQQQNTLSNSMAAPRTTVYPLDTVPTPNPMHTTTYRNQNYSYTFVYPSNWKVNESEFENVSTVDVSYQVETGPNVNPLAVNCTTNANGWDAQSWWQHNPTGTQIGFSMLKSGVQAFLSVTSNKQAEQGYTQYIVVHNAAVCWIDAFTANAANEDIIDATVNTFRWN